MKGTYLIKNEDCHARDIEDFLSVLELCKDNIFCRCDVSHKYGKTGNLYTMKVVNIA